MTPPQGRAHTTGPAPITPTTTATAGRTPAAMATHADLRNRTAEHSTPTLVTALQMLERKYTHAFASISREELMVRSAIIRVLEIRYPAADAVIAAAVDACPDDKDFDYVAVLLSAIPETEKQ